MIRSVMFDFGGVISSSPFEAFSRYEDEHGLPAGFLRLVNSTDPDTNAWAQMERGELAVHEFAAAFEAEALTLGHRLDGRDVLSVLHGELRPEMVEVVRRCSERFAIACLTNNFATGETAVRPELAQVLALFDRVFESSTLGIRKPEPSFYRLACEGLGVAPEEVVYLDDLGINLKPARAMGMHTIKVVSSDQAIAELAEATGLVL